MDLKEKLLSLKYRTTGIGSVPHTDHNAVTDFIIEKCRIPYWPQCVNIDVKENMLFQFTENVPCITLKDNKVILDGSADREACLLQLFENLTSNNYEYFKISREYAHGFYSFLEKIKTGNIDFVKGQVVGPVSFMSPVTGMDGKSILYDDILSDAVTRALAMKGVWQAKKIREAGKIPVIFFDEPAMAGFGSAFMSLNREQFLEIFNKLTGTVREHENVLIGMHICGNTDWETVLSTDIDIISFDSFAYSENFVLYKDAVKRFLEKDGFIAWGIVPTLDYNEQINQDIIISKIESVINTLAGYGIGREFLLKRSVLTPSCGTGGLSVEYAEKIIDLTYRLGLYYTV